MFEVITYLAGAVIYAVVLTAAFRRSRTWEWPHWLVLVGLNALLLAVSGYHVYRWGATLTEVAVRGVIPQTILTTVLVVRDRFLAKNQSVGTIAITIYALVGAYFYFAYVSLFLIHPVIRLWLR